MSYPADASGIVKVIRLRSIGIELPSQKELRENSYGPAGWSARRRVVGGRRAEAIEVAVEDAGVAGFAQED